MQDPSCLYLLQITSTLETLPKQNRDLFQACEQYKVIYLKLHSRNNGDASALLSPFNATLHLICLAAQ